MVFRSYGACNDLGSIPFYKAVYKFLKHSLLVPIDKNITSRYASVRYELNETPT